MAFGVYVHIPYCLQRCTYCDFATYERSKIFPSNEYIDLLLSEIDQKKSYFGGRSLDTLYFGGGTPSLLPAREIIALIEGLAKQGYPLSSTAEVTIEINPATVDTDKLKAYLDSGINRFSVGAQTFDDRLLKMVKREHNSAQTRMTLELLASRNVNFSFDLLFALPTQTVAGVEKDLDLALEYGSRHISPYCLTVPDGHPLSTGRAPEDEQVEMFHLIRHRLRQAGFQPYEISNFAKPGAESRHNLLYWTDQEYWGLGLSAHSSMKKEPWGIRFWNPNAIGEYRAQVEKQRGMTFDSPDRYPQKDSFEILERHQALTDFCHISLRLQSGLSLSKAKPFIPPAAEDDVRRRLTTLVEKDLLRQEGDRYVLSEKGVVLSNQVFKEMTFLRDEL